MLVKVLKYIMTSTHRGRADSQGTAAAVWGKASGWSRAAHSAPAARLLPGSWLTLHWAWRGYNSKSDVRSLPLRSRYSWIRCGRCWSGWRGRSAACRRRSTGSSWWGSGAGRAAGRLYRCAPESGPTSAGSWPRKMTVLWRPATTTLTPLQACAHRDGHVGNISCY